MSDMPDALRTFKAQLFQALAHPTRIAVLEHLRDGELTAGALQERLRIEQANLSQHLGVLRTRQIVTARKAGNQVFYSLRDPVLIEILDLLKRFFHTQLHETLSVLSEVGTADGEPA